MMTWILGIVALAIIVLLVILQRADGPYGPIAGGKLMAGNQIEPYPTDWISALSVDANEVFEVELQLESTGRSRTTGAIVYDGVLYIPCDLGYVWRRIPDFTTRAILRILWLVKSWHQRVLTDDRVVIRLADQKLEARLVRVEDNQRVEAIAQHLTSQAEQYFKQTLLPVDTDINDIWLFRVEPRNN